MASQAHLEHDTEEQPVLVRIGLPERKQLWQLIFRRYPQAEWGTFARFGWRETPDGLVLILHHIDEPLPGDLSEKSVIVQIQGQYTRRILRLTSEHHFAVGVIHSHPEDFFTGPSPSDYDMEGYYSELLEGYTGDRPFVSLIFSKSNGLLSGTGRVWWRKRWHTVAKFAVEGEQISIEEFQKPKLLEGDAAASVARLASAFSDEAAAILADSTVGVVGLSGTGSPIVELLARAGVGKVILIDPDVFTTSNLERLHGSSANDVSSGISKAELAKRHVLSIKPDCDVTAIKGRLPQEEVLNSLLWADLVFGCTDLHSARVALSDLSLRFCIPVLDVGVTMEGGHGSVTGQALQINRMFGGDACVYCRGIIDSRLVTQELMPEDEQTRRRNEAEKATQEGREPGAYWVDTPQLNTVGYLTTTAGGLTAGFGIGYLTGRFSMPNDRLELSISRKGTAVVERNTSARLSCNCNHMRGIADQNPMLIFKSPASHWPTPQVV